MAERDDLILTDLRLFGFPVYFDLGMDRNVVELRHPRGDRVRLILQPDDPPPEDALRAIGAVRGC